MPTSFLVARFIRMYGMAAYRGAWPGPGGVVPARVFFLLWQQIPKLTAGERLELAEGSRLGQALVEAPKSPDVKREARRLARLAVPLIYPPLKE